MRKESSFLESAKESTLNFLLPSRKCQTRERILQEAYDWWSSDAPDSYKKYKDRAVHFEVTAHSSATSDNYPESVTFPLLQIDKVTIPHLLLLERRKSLEEMHRTSSEDVSGHVMGNKNGDGEEGHGHHGHHHHLETLPSLQLRRWQKLGHVMGVAIGMKILSKIPKTASDPELDTTGTDMGKTASAMSNGGENKGITSNRHSFDDNGCYGDVQQRPRLARLVRKSSDSQSDYILEARDFLSSSPAPAPPWSPTSLSSTPLSPVLLSPTPVSLMSLSPTPPSPTFPTSQEEGMSVPIVKVISPQEELPDVP
jgi:hypothetical protein